MPVLNVVVKHKGKTPPRLMTVDIEAECRMAAIKSGYTWQEFQDLAGDDIWANGGDSKCKVLIMYRVMNKLEEISWQS